ncbi:hypothetical protein ABT369_39040 [Dactylosporangium sp. NPDC000244]|uniref:hypothetical protein n=1 Tax=Dactylosporangium sp. NPDC000244 TaxID=3154365 RepID=UPI00332965BC
MEILLGAMVLALLGVKTWGTARTEHELAKQGTVPPRMEAKYGAAGARAKVEQYGFLDYLRDAYHDYWGRRGDALVAARTAEPAEGKTKVGFWDRIAAASAVITGGVKRVAEKTAPAVRKLIDPVEPKPVEPASPEPKPEPKLAVDTGNVEPGTRRVANNGDWEEYRDGRWQPVPKNPDTFGGATAATATPAGGTMTAPTGEATNYETTINELTALAGEQRQHIDQCTAALQAVEAAKARIGDMQESYRASAAAAQNTAEHLAARNLDGVTLANAGTTADAMPAGKVDEMFDQLEAMESEAKARLADAETALAATEANLQHIQATYGDAHATVAGNLGGDASFLDGGGSAGGGGARVAPSASPWGSPVDEASNGHPIGSLGDQLINGDDPTEIALRQAAAQSGGGVSYSAPRAPLAVPPGTREGSGSTGRSDGRSWTG